MGGDITVSSILGRGTTFRFDIRVEPVQKTADLEMTPANRKVIGLAPNQPTYRILVAEDNSMNRLALVRLLKSCGFQVQEASNGQDAIARWKSWRPDLIWMDIRMPEMDGCEATKRIKGECEIMEAGETEGERSQESGVRREWSGISTRQSVYH